jgi:caffeoyl-CoA O-methyltransferase
VSAAGEKGFGQGSEELARWVERVFRPEDALLREVVERTGAAGLRAIQVGPFDGLHLEVLARATGARRAVEIGTLGGYSGVCLLRGMGADGFLHTFEREPATAEVAKETFRRAGLAAQVRVHVGDARETLREVEPEGPFDLVFIDADKTGYPDYLAWAEEHLRLGGTVLADNAFGWGGVAQDRYQGRHSAEGVEALKRFNLRLAQGGRFRATMLPTEEGLAFGVKVR